MNNFLRIICLLFLISLFACTNRPTNKIRLSEHNTESGNTTQNIASKILKIESQGEKTIVISYFKNKTADASVNWLQRGLTGMLESELAQSPFLTVIPLKKLQQFGTPATDIDTLFFSAKNVLKAAQQVNADLVISGNFYFEHDSLIISVEMYSTDSGILQNQVSVRGENLESIFSMVNQLSDNLRGQLREKQSPSEIKGHPSTQSLAAFRHYTSGMSEMDKYKYINAEKEFKIATKLDSNYALAYMKLAAVQFVLGKYEEGYQNYKQTERHLENLSDTDKLQFQIQKLQVEKDYSKMVDAVRKSVEKYPANVEFRLQFARILRNGGFLDEALEEFEHILETDPSMKGVYNDIGYLYADRGDYSTAIKYIDKYRQVSPDEANPYDSKGELLMTAGKLKAAVKEFQTALVKWPQFTNSSLHLASIYRELGDEQQACEYIKLAQKSVSDNAFNKGILYDELLTYWRFNKNDKAEKVLQQLRDEYPFDASPIFLAQEYYSSIGDERGSEKVRREAFLEFEKQIQKSNSEFQKSEDFRRLTIGEIFPADLSVPLLEKTISNLKSESELINYNFALSLLNFRIGNIEKARLYVKRQDYNKVIELLLSSKRTGWSHTWRYIFETLEYEPLYADLREHFFYKLIEAGKKTDRKDLETIGNLAKVRLLERKNQLKSSKTHLNYLGFPQEKKWLLMGPLGGKNVSGFYYSFPPEETIEPLNTIKYNGRTFNWTKADDHYSDGYINLRKIFSKWAWKTAYALIYINSPHKQKAQFRIGGEDSYKVWLNDEFVWQRYGTKNGQLDKDIITIVLRPGNNKVLLKVNNTISGWGYYFRVTNSAGNGIKNIQFLSPLEMEQQLANHTN